MANFSDDYFRDLSDNIMDDDLIRAGYKILKVTGNRFALPQTLSSNVLRGDLNNVPFPVPSNFHEGGMFADAADRISFSGPQPESHQPVTGVPPEQLVIAAPPEQLAIAAPPEQSVVTAPPEQSVVTAPPKQLVKAEQNEIVTIDGQTIVVTPADKQLVGHTNTNPFRHDPLINHEGGIKLANIGETQLIIARGPDNSKGRPGFYGGIMVNNLFGSYPTGAIEYNPNDVDQIDEHGQYIDQIKKQKMIECKPKQVVKLLEQLSIPQEIHNLDPTKQDLQVTDQITDLQPTKHESRESRDLELTDKQRLHQLEQTVAHLVAEQARMIAQMDKYHWSWSCDIL